MKFPAPDNVGQVLAVKPGGDNPIVVRWLAQAVAANRGTRGQRHRALLTALLVGDQFRPAIVAQGQCSRARPLAQAAAGRK